MIHTVSFADDWRCFKKGDKFDFRPGVNLLVGDQGCGKSSLLKGIIDFTAEKDTRAVVVADKGAYYNFDFEHGNPRTLGYLTTVEQMVMRQASHGESNMAIVRGIRGMEDCVALIDEPDTALSIRSCMALVSELKNLVARGSQVLAAVHNPVVIQAFDEVYSLEHRRWLPSAEFIGLHLEG